MKEWNTSSVHRKTRFGATKVWVWIFAVKGGRQVLFCHGMSPCAVTRLGLSGGGAGLGRSRVGAGDGAGLELSRLGHVFGC